MELEMVDTFARALALWHMSQFPDLDFSETPDMVGVEEGEIWAAMNKEMPSDLVDDIHSRMYQIRKDLEKESK